MNYYCMYCSQRCSKKFPESIYWDCEVCKVRFVEGDSGCDLISFTRELRGREYRLDLFVANNKTMLVAVDKEDLLHWIDLGGDTIADIKGVLNGVKPENVEDKIKNLLLFL